MQERLEALRKKFIAGIPQRLDDMAAAPSPVARLQVLHKLIGAALSYKAQALGELARSIEAALESGVDTNWPACLAALHVEFRKLEAGDE